MERLVPDPGPTSVADQLGDYRPWEDPPAERPHLALNFAGTLDGRASIDGRSGAIGSDTDTTMLVGLRERFDAVMIGAGTMRVEQYGRIVSDPARRVHREELGLPGDPLVVIVGGLDLPWDAGLFTDGGGEVVLFTSAEEDPPATATPLEVIRASDGRVDLDHGDAPPAHRARGPLDPLRGRPAPPLPAAGGGARRRALPRRSRRNSSAPGRRFSRARSPRSPSSNSPGSCGRTPSSSPAT